MIPPIDETPGTVDGPGTGKGAGAGDAVATLLGLAALAVAGLPLALLLHGWEDGPRGAWAFADARNWPALRHFCLAGTLGLLPALLLARRSFDDARHLWAKLPAALAIALALPMIPAAVIQAVWWVGG